MLHTSPTRALVRWTTGDNSPNLRPGYESDLRAAYPPDLARQELDAQFVTRRGTVYADFSRDFAPVGNLMRWDPRPDRPIFLALDFGFRHPAALWIQGIHGTASMPADPMLDSFVVIDEHLPVDCPIDRFLQTILSKGKPFAAFGDPAGNNRDSTGLADLRRCSALGLHVRTASDPDRRRLVFGIALVQSLILSSEGRRRLFLAVDAQGRCRTPGLLAALENYAWPDDRARDAPVKDGLHDHPLDALRYWAINHVRPPSPLAGRSSRPRAISL